jgi:EmrB/QacA subfamily drug resistance transporter
MQNSTPIHRWRAFSLLAVAAFMTVMDLTIVNTALPTIGRDLHFSQTSLLWVVTAYELAYGGFLLLGGRAADLLGRRRVIMVGLAVFTAASLGASLAGSETVLIAMRATQGLGAAMFLPAALSTVRNMFTEGADRNKALGIWGALAALGASAGLVFGGLLTRFAGWQYIFLVNVPVGTAALLLIRRVVPETRIDAARRRNDPLGALTVTGALVLLAYAVAQAPRVGWGSSRTFAELAIGAALLGAFLVIEGRGTAPLMPLRLFRLQSLAGANAVGFLLGASFYSFIFIGTLYMQQVLGFSALQGGFAWATSGIVSMLFAGLSQALVTKMSAKLVMAFGMTVVGVGILWMTRAPVHGHFLGNLLGPILVAAGIGQELGGALGIAIASSIAASHYTALVRGGDTVRAALTGGFHSALWVAGAIALLAIPVTFLLIRKDEMPNAVAATAVIELQPAPAG